MTEQKRSKVAHYLNTTPLATAETWDLIGSGVSSAQMDMSPQESTEQYVNEDIARTFLDGYQPSLPIDQIVYPGDDVFDFVDSLRNGGPSIGGEDLTELVEVQLYGTPDTAGTSYPAIKWNVQIAITSGAGGDGGGRARIGYKINVQGAQVAGTFNTSTLAFTAS